MISLIIKEIKCTLNWYFELNKENKIRTNYMLVIAALIALAYFNDKRHNENYNVLYNRIVYINNARSKEQTKYADRLEFYTEKFNNLLEIVLENKEKIEESRDKKN